MKQNWVNPLNILTDWLSFSITGYIHLNLLSNNDEDLLHLLDFNDSGSDCLQLQLNIAQPKISQPMQPVFIFFSAAQECWENWVIFNYLLRFCFFVLSMSTLLSFVCLSSWNFFVYYHLFCFLLFATVDSIKHGAFSSRWVEWCIGIWSVCLFTYIFCLIVYIEICCLCS